MYLDRALRIASFILILYHPSFPQTTFNLDSLNGLSSVEYYGFPTPEPTPDRLFFIQRNISQNVVVYDANLTGSGELNRQEPVRMYWKRYNDGLGGKEFELRWFERRLGYRLKVIDSAPNRCDVTLISYKKKRFSILKTNDGNVEARITINNRLARMTYIFMHMEDSFWPDVNYLEIGGEDLETGEFIFEQFLP